MSSSNYRISYAQNREDIILNGFFNDVKKGFYVDVGANHPDTLSITKIFYDRGWNGINLEPNPYLFKLIQRQRKRDINLNIGAADKNGELVLREYPEGDGLSTFSAGAQKEYQKKDSEYKKYTKKYNDYSVEVRRLADVFAEYATKTIHFMNVDVEGFEYEVLSGNDWKKYRPQIICIEANHIVRDWRPLLKDAEYTLAFNDGLNNYYVADEHADLHQKFSYAKTMLLDRPVVSALVLDDMRQLENRIARQEITTYNLRQEIERLNAYIAGQARLRALVRQLGVAIHRIIILRIEKLNKSKPHHLPALKISDNVSPEERLAKIEAYDIEAYYGVKIHKPWLYRYVMAIYMFVARGTYVIMRAIFKRVRRLAHA